MRLDGLPKRVEFAEIGSVRLPANVFTDLRSTRNGVGWTVGDVGALACLLHCFEIRDATLVQGGRFEEDVLVAKGRELRFASHVQAPLNAADGNRVVIDETWLSKAAGSPSSIPARASRFGSGRRRSRYAKGGRREDRAQF